jgi:hypothetical protein
MGNWSTLAKLSAVALALVCVVAIVDFASTSDELPANVSAEYRSPAHAASVRAEHDFEQRERIYGAIAALAVLVIVFEMAPRSPTRRRRFFATVGTAGLGVGLLTYLPFSYGGPLHDVEDWGPLLPAIALLGAAALGGLLAFRDSRAAETPAGPPGTLVVGRSPLADLALRNWPWVGIALTLETAVLVLLAGRTDCTAQSDFRGIIDVTFLGGVVFGLLSLLAKRWVIALTCVVVGPLVIFTQLWVGC